VKLVVWDIAGQDDFAQLRKAYYQNSSGAFFVFDTTRPETLSRVGEWLEALYGVTGEIPLVLLENKVDLESAIEDKAVKKHAKKFKVDHIQTSAKEDTNVEEAFAKMTKQILKNSRARAQGK
jgi:small GTP-binding protein